jgi:Lar family restriction alleviation protein
MGEEQKMSDDLKPCPFCGGKDIDGKMHKDGRVHCYRCGADGPAVPYSYDDKAFTWNNRTTLAEIEGEKP